MGFVDENGYSLINDEQKIRLTLSNRATITIAKDMDTFGISNTTKFINTVFDHYKLEAKSSISLYLEQRKLELTKIFETCHLDSNNEELVIQTLLSNEKKDIDREISQFNSNKGYGKLYRINDNNIKYLEEVCEEDKYYKRRPALYVRSVIEEYCSLPFIERERIYRKHIYEMIETACEKSRILKVKVHYNGSDHFLYVYPYKIVPDPSHTQSYLACYSLESNDKKADKRIASFSMARINPTAMLMKTFHLNKAEIAEIEAKLSAYSPAYLIGEPEQIKVKLTDNGKKIYKSRLFSRPEKIEALSTEDTYIFDCTPMEIFNFFFSFGPDAEIISPKSLRVLFKERLEKSLINYQS